MNNFRNTQEYLSFQPFSNSWVAIHPNPKGIIQFVGSFFVFGSLPTVFYNSLFRSLYNQRYTIIAYPCSVIPPLIWRLGLVDHWKASIRLLKEEYTLRYELIDYLLKYGNQDSIDVYLEHSNYFWLGHSLGCKYISLLEILSNDRENLIANLLKCKITTEDLEMIKNELEVIEFERQKSNSNIRNLLSKQEISQSADNQKFIIDQPSIFLAPEIYGTQQNKQGKTRSAIPLFKLFPTGNETLCLIKQSKNLFNLIALIAFEHDGISKDDVDNLNNEFSTRSNQFISKIFPGCDFKLEFLSSLFSHLKPLSNNSEPLANCLDKIFHELKQRPIPNYVPQQVECLAYKVK
jgi:hypothetical protein